MLKDKKYTFLLIVFVVFAVAFFAFSRFREIQRKSLIKTLPTSSFKYSEALNSNFITCKLLLSQTDKRTQEFRPGILILRSTECMYVDVNGDLDSVIVPLVFVNKTTQQFYAINTSIDTIDQPNDAYIDGVMANIFKGNENDPIVNLLPVTDFSKTDEKFAIFFNGVIPNEWSKEFLETNNHKLLLETESGQQIFLATGISYVHQ